MKPHRKHMFTTHNFIVNTSVLNTFLYASLIGQKNVKADLCMLATLRPTFSHNL